MSILKEHFTNWKSSSLTIGFGLGTIAALGWWHYVHKPMVKTREDYYAQLAAQKKAEEEA